MSVKKSLRIGGQSYVELMKKQHQFGEAAQEAQETEHAQACRSFGVNHYLLWGTGIPLEGLARSSTLDHWCPEVLEVF